MSCKKYTRNNIRCRCYLLLLYFISMTDKRTQNKFHPGMERELSGSYLGTQGAT